MILPRVLSNKGIEEIRLKRKKEGSQPFEVTISDLTASAEKIYGFDSDSNIRKYLPLNYCRIINRGGTDLKIYIGQGSNGEVILNDTIYTHYGNFYSFTLENLNASDTATGSNIYATVQRKSTEG